MNVSQLKPVLRRYLPLYAALGQWRAHRRYRTAHGQQAARDVFASHFQQRHWGGESASGRGSGLESTAAVRARLPGLLDELAVQTLIDAPCGDLFWMQHIPLGGRSYIGIDIVSELIEENRQRFGEERRFLVADLCHDELPAGDLLLCRDCFIHLPNTEVRAALRNMRRAGIVYVLTNTYPRTRRNIDIAMGDFRPVNLRRPPFNLPPPLKLIDDADGERGGPYADKSLGLWRLHDLALD